ncbi:GGDEF domain-containing protein [Marinomonas polaris]|uniref:GGDEF domain-containing protein n=1 Tax=Marinomonas polaris TaxID=293552 RepID=UPI003F9D9701
MPNNTQVDLNHKLTLRIIELSIITIFFALIFRPLIVDLPIQFTVIILLDLVIVTALYVIVRFYILPKLEIILSLCTAVIILLPTLALSGGVNSQAACILPLCPIFAALIGGYRESLIITIILALGVILATIFSQHITDLTGEIHSQQKSIDRGFWLTISIIFSGVFGRFFLKRYAELTQQLKNENIQDPLTGLFNRRGLNLHFSTELDNANTANLPLSLILIDIDYFKKINDMYGHDIGDVCLIEIANTLSQAIRKNDIIARFGGEEFIIILPNTPKNETVAIAEKLKVLISNQKFSSFNLSLTITQGLTEYNKNNDNALKMIKRADKALYKGKDKGRNCVEQSE